MKMYIVHCTAKLNNALTSANFNALFGVAFTEQCDLTLISAILKMSLNNALNHMPLTFQ